MFSGFSFLVVFLTAYYQIGLLIFGLSILIICFFFRINALTYKSNVVKEWFRGSLKRIWYREKYLVLKKQGKDLKLPTTNIHYIKSAGNYIEVYTDRDKHLIRGKIGEFINEIPDAPEFFRIHRSYIIRLDKVEKCNGKAIQINGNKIPISDAYRSKFLAQPALNLSQKV